MADGRHTQRVAISSVWGSRTQAGRTQYRVKSPAVGPSLAAPSRKGEKPEENGFSDTGRVQYISDAYRPDPIGYERL